MNLLVSEGHRAGKTVGKRPLLLSNTFEAYLRPGEMLSLKPSSFLAVTEGGVRSWVMLLFSQTGAARSKAGEADDTINLDSKRCLWGQCSRQRQPQDKPFAQPELHRQLVAVPPSRSESAGGYGALSRTPLWSFRGQSRKPANVGIHTKTRTMEISQACAPLREKRTCQPKLIRPLVQAHCPSMLLHGHASLTPPRLLRFFVIDLFSANTDLQQLFLNRGVQCATKLDLFLVTTHIC